MMDRTPQFDEVEYLDLATRLAAGEGYVDETGRPVAFWPVGYPAVLSLMFRLAGPSSVVGVGLQVALSVAACLLLSIVGSRVLGPGPGRLAGLMLAIYPTHVMYSTLHLTEPLFMLLLLGVASCLFLGDKQRLAWLCFGGLLFGLAVLTRPLILPLGVALPFALHRSGQRIGKTLLATAVVVAMTLITILPWLWRNHELSGRWTTVTTSGGYNFWVGNNPAARGGYVHPDDIKVSLQDDDGYDWHRGYRLGWEWIRENPATAALSMPLKISHLVALETDGVLWNLKGFDRAPPLLLVVFLLLVANVTYVGVLATASLALMNRPDLPLMGRFTVLLCGYMLAIVLIFFGDPRFHLPLIPFFLLSSASMFVGERSTSLKGVLGSQPGRLRNWAGLMAILGLLMLVNLSVKYFEGAW
jgi:4-amino-4-deoxy-L-arabinose transferase-like glycosyltransferase